MSIIILKVVATADNVVVEEYGVPMPLRPKV
jgi:hypothetical protein